MVIGADLSKPASIAAVMGTLVSSPLLLRSMCYRTAIGSTDIEIWTTSMIHQQNYPVLLFMTMYLQNSHSNQPQ